MFVCASRESNPGHNVGNVVLYHSTTGAKLNGPGGNRTLDPHLSKGTGLGKTSKNRRFLRCLVRVLS